MEIFNYDFAHDPHTLPSNSTTQIGYKKGVNITTRYMNLELISAPWVYIFPSSYSVSDQEIIYESRLWVRQILDSSQIPKIYYSRIRNIYEDHRLCCFGLVMESQNFKVKILMTSDWIYGYYEQSAFSSLIPLVKRGDYKKEELVGIGITRSNVNFYYNQKIIFSISSIGHRLADQYQVCDRGGPNILIIPASIKCGIGHFSFLDHQLPNNYSRDLIIKDYEDYPIYRSASGLASMKSPDNYREIYPNFLGYHDDIDPEITFAYMGTDPQYFIFGQMIKTRLKILRLYIPSKISPLIQGLESEEEDDSIRELVEKIPRTIPQPIKTSSKESLSTKSQPDLSLRSLYRKSKKI